MLVKTPHSVRTELKKKNPIHNVQTCTRINQGIEVVLKAGFAVPLHRNFIVLFHRSGDNGTRLGILLLISSDFRTAYCSVFLPKPIYMNMYLNKNNN